MIDILVFLQCAWRTNGEFKSREYWLDALWKSYTGKRLSEMLPENKKIYIENSTRKVGDNPDAVFPPDLEFMRRVINTVKPRKILACGKIAQEGLSKLGVNFIPAPHPAYRALSKKITGDIKIALSKEEML